MILPGKQEGFFVYWVSCKDRKGLKFVKKFTPLITWRSLRKIFSNYFLLNADTPQFNQLRYSFAEGV